MTASEAKKELPIADCGLGIADCGLAIRFEIRNFTAC